MSVGKAEFEKLALEQLDLLYRVARRLTRDPASAEDLVQDTYLRAFRNSDGFELREFGIRPWLLRIMHNLHATGMLRQGRQPRAVSDEQLDGPAPQVLAPTEPDAFRNFEALGQAMDQRLVEACDALPPEYRQVLLLWAIDELSYKEIAHALDVPIGTVMSRLHRGRQRLAEDLRDFAKSEGILPRRSRELLQPGGV